MLHWLPTVHCSSVITACGKAREWTRAVDLLDTMQQDGLKPTVICYNAAVAACGIVGQVRRPLFAFSILVALFSVYCAKCYTSM
jgi:pentatricopeptide repeat protein